jgi:hemolysin III
MTHRSPRYSVGEEIAASVIHGLGIVLSIAGLVILTAFASVRGNAWHITSCSIFGATLVILYATSTLYHAIPNRRAKAALRVLDHSAIFLLIAGTYTPFSLVSLRGSWGWSLFGIVWGIAVLGIIFKVTMLRRWTRVSVALYLILGWVALIAMRPLLEALQPGGLALLLAGGAAYSLGVVFYAWRSLPYHHAIWHAFVLTGSVLHFFAVLLFVIPAPLIPGG